MPRHGPPRVTVITTTFNHEAFIGECIQSVLGQSFQEWEHIIVDDGSTDETVAIVNSYQHPRMRLIQQGHRGIDALADSYNRALRLAKGDLIAILEGDDEWPAEKLSRQVPLFDEDIVLTWGRGLYKTNQRRIATPRPSSRWREAELQNNPRGASIPPLLMGGTFLTPACTIMMRAEALRRIGGFCQAPGTRWVDRSTACLLAMEGQFAASDEYLGIWRVHQAQVTQAKPAPGAIATGDWFLNQLSDQDIARLNLEPFKRKYGAFSHWLAARRALLSGNRKDARAACWRAIRHPACPVEIRLKSIAGVALSALPQGVTRRLLGTPLPWGRRGRP